MKLPQRIVLFIGAVGVFHSSLVPPVKQSGIGVCRYHEFMERAWPFVREYGAGGVDGVALLTEYGVILSLTTLAWLVVGMLSERTRAGVG